MRLRLAVYQALVNRVPEINRIYHTYREQVHGIGRICAWFYLLWLNVLYRIPFYAGGGHSDNECCFEKKKLYTGGSESSLSFRESPQDFVQRLLSYDVISFDIFDTLLFRPFDKPTDLFFIVASELSYPDFARIRQTVEAKARQLKAAKLSNGAIHKNHSAALKTVPHVSTEINIDEIYTLMEEETGIPKEEGMQAELDAELKYCYANPYFLEVFQALSNTGKRIILTSDMYLDSVFLKKLLQHAGYDMEKIPCYVSCEQGAAKHDGSLFERVKQLEGKGKHYIHIGDNPWSDVTQAKKHGFDAMFYPNVNTKGRLYRAEEMSAITGSMYRGIVNAHLHNGLKQYTIPYEYGFVYGGLFVIGYCRFIHDYVKQHNIDKILFLARDGDVLQKVYQKIYPKEVTEYAYWSRLCAAKLTAGRYRYDYFRRFLYHKVNQKYMLESVFNTMELSDLLPALYQEQQLYASAYLTNRNVETVKQFLLSHWTEVLAHYKEQIIAAGLYYKRLLGGAKRVAAVDIGWAGSGAMALKHMVWNVWGFHCSITGIIAGTNTVHNAEPDASEAQLHDGNLVSYLYSQEFNRDLWKFHDQAKGHNLYWELLLSSISGSFKGFYLDSDATDGVRLEFKEENANREAILEIQKGILDFAEVFLERVGMEHTRINGRDAYAAMGVMLNEENKGYRELLRGLLDEENVC